MWDSEPTTPADRYLSARTRPWPSIFTGKLCMQIITSPVCSPLWRPRGPSIILVYLRMTESRQHRSGCGDLQDDGLLHPSRTDLRRRQRLFDHHGDSVLWEGHNNSYLTRGASYGQSGYVN